jgi:hypothetical protein
MASGRRLLTITALITSNAAPPAATREWRAPNC